LDLNNVFKEQIKILVKDGDATIDDIPDPEKVIEYVSQIVIRRELSFLVEGKNHLKRLEIFQFQQPITE